MKPAFIAFVAILSFAACKKDKGDTTKPVINVTSPQANQAFNAGQVINISASISDNSELHEVSLEHCEQRHRR